MSLTDAAALRALLERHGFSFSRALGQNFLTAAWVPERIAQSAGLGEDVGVLEIGPGVGCLTEQLARRAGRVLAVEKDESLRGVLSETLKEVFPGKTPVTVMGLLRDKAAGPILAHVKEYAVEVLTVTVPNPRMLTADELKEKFLDAGIGPVKAMDSIEEAVKEGLTLTEEKGTFLLVTGSFYMVSHARRILMEMGK